MSKTIACVAETPEQAAQIIGGLKKEGFSSKDISVLMPKSKEWEELEKELHSKRTEGAAIGAATGGLLGVLIGLATFTIPGLEPLLAVGPIVAALADAAAGGAVGAVAGALLGIRLPDQAAKIYEQSLAEGKVLITVQATDENQQSRARTIFTANRGEHISVA
jgi:hypothetical protein